MGPGGRLPRKGTFLGRCEADTERGRTWNGPYARYWWRWSCWRSQSELRHARPVTGHPSRGGNGTGGTEEPGTAEEPQEDPAVALIETKCSMCHTTDRVWSADYDRDGWVETIDRMKVQGLVVTDEEYDQILDYLANQ